MRIVTWNRFPIKPK